MLTVRRNTRFLQLRISSTRNDAVLVRDRLLTIEAMNEVLEDGINLNRLLLFCLNTMDGILLLLILSLDLRGLPCTVTLEDVSRASTVEDGTRITFLLKDVNSSLNNLMFYENGVCVSIRRRDRLLNV